MSLDLYDPKELDSNFFINVEMGSRMLSGPFSKLPKKLQHEVLNAAEDNARTYCKRVGKEFVGLTIKKVAR